MKQVATLSVACLAWLLTLPASASVVNDYTASDDVWNAPIAPKHFLLDLRSSFSPFVAGPFAQPTASLVWGIRPGLEAGLFSGYALGFPGGATPGTALAGVAPYLKFKLPYALGATSFGLVTGFQLPVTGSLFPPTAGVEGVAIVPLSKVWELHLGLGAGGDFGARALLGHGNASLNWTLPTGQSLFAEAYTMLSGAAAPTFGQRLGALVPINSGWSIDGSIALGEGPSGLTGFSPQLGFTLTI